MGLWRFQGQTPTYAIANYVLNRSGVARSGEELITEAIWPRNQTCPNEGDVRWCQVYLQTDEQPKVGHKRWLLYQTGNSLFNGVDTPKELDALAIVEAEVLEVEHETRETLCQWWKVKCVQVIPLASIPQRLPSLPLVNLGDSKPQGEATCASNTLCIYDSGGQVTESRIYVKDTCTGELTHFIFYEISLSNECEIYNWPVK